MAASTARGQKFTYPTTLEEGRRRTMSRSMVCTNIAGNVQALMRMHAPIHIHAHTRSTGEQIDRCRRIHIFVRHAP